MSNLELSVVGMQYRTTKQYRNTLRSKLPRDCRLEREPENDFDPSAIKVLLKSPEIHIGYLNRQIAERFAPWMDSDRIRFTSVKLVDVDPAAGDGTLTVQFKRVSSKT